MRKKHGIPRYGKHRIFRKSDIMDGTVACFFGPNQDPELSRPLPNDWRLHNWVLKPPQMVWLTCETVDNFAPSYREKTEATIDATWATTTSSGNYYTGVHLPSSFVNPGGSWCTLTNDCIAGASSDGQWGYAFYDEANDSGLVDFNDGINCARAFGRAGQITASGGSPYPSPWYDQTVPNPQKDLYDKFHQDIFPQVKSTLEAIRPHRTWIKPFEWLTYTGDPDLPYDRSSIETTYNFNVSRYSGLILPDTSDLTDGLYIGSDFLHIHIGPMVNDFGAGHTDLRNYGTITPYYDAIKDAYKHFPNYAVKLYGLGPFDINFSDCPMWPISTLRPPVPFLKVADSSNPPHNLSVDPISFIGDPVEYAIWQQKVDEFNVELETYGDYYNDQYDQNITLFKNIAEDLKDYGYSYEGNAMDFTADSIVQVIADYYGFNPDDGKDL